MICSMVEIRLPEASAKQLQFPVSTIFEYKARTFGASLTSTRTKFMPVSAAAGLMTKTDGKPECSPTPSNLFFAYFLPKKELK